MNLKCRIFGHKWTTTKLCVWGEFIGESITQCGCCPHEVQHKYGTKPPNPAIIKHRVKLVHWTV